MRSIGSRSFTSTVCGWTLCTRLSMTVRSTCWRNWPSAFARWRGGGARQYTAQWNDDVHHGLHTAATGEQAGYYAEYQGDTAKLARALAEGFAFQGEMMEYRGEPRGELSGHLPPTAFVAFIQNH